jgi:hypothetical protein
MNRRGNATGIRRNSGATTELVVLVTAVLVGYIFHPAGASSSRGKAVPESLIMQGSLAKLERYMEGVAAALDPRARGALTKLEGMGRRLLALRGYLRSEGALGAKWSWTAEEIKRFEGSAEYRGALSEVEKVRRKFAELNPGYELYVNTQVRTLEKQIRLWNETSSVQVAADQLRSMAQQELATPAYKEAPDAAGLNRFRQFLKSARPATTPTVATPGLSQHGQLRAFDFQVQKGSQLVAGTDSSTIASVWEGQGWTKKLKAAVVAASNKFKGPLVSPREPWHYDYVP